MPYAGYMFVFSHVLAYHPWKKNNKCARECNLSILIVLHWSPSEDIRQVQTQFLKGLYLNLTHDLLLKDFHVMH